MRKIIGTLWFKTICLVLINSFLLLDIAWAGGTELSVIKPTEMLSPSVQISQQVLLDNFNELYELKDFNTVFDMETKTEMSLPEQMFERAENKWSHRWQRVKDWASGTVKLMSQSYKSDKKDDDNDLFRGLKSVLLPVFLITAIVALSSNLGWAGDGLSAASVDMISKYEVPAAVVLVLGMIFAKLVKIVLRKRAEQQKEVKVDSGDSFDDIEQTIADIRTILVNRGYKSDKFNELVRLVRSTKVSIEKANSILKNELEILKNRGEKTKNEKEKIMVEDGEHIFPVATDWPRWGYPDDVEAEYRSEVKYKEMTHKVKVFIPYYKESIFGRTLSILQNFKEVIGSPYFIIGSMFSTASCVSLFYLIPEFYGLSFVDSMVKLELSLIDFANRWYFFVGKAMGKSVFITMSLIYVFNTALIYLLTRILSEDKEKVVDNFAGIMFVSVGTAPMALALISLSMIFYLPYVGSLLLTALFAVSMVSVLIGISKIFGIDSTSKGDKSKLMSLLFPMLLSPAFIALSSNFSWAGDGVLSESVNWFMTHWFISGFVVGIVLLELYFLAWKVFSPVSFHLWKLTSKNLDVRNSAVKALGAIGDKRAVDPLIKTLRDRSPYVQKTAVKALGELGDERAVEPLIEKMRSFANDGVDEIKALGKIGGEKAVRKLIYKLSYGSTGARIFAAKALGEIRDKSAVEPLIKSLGDSSGIVRSAAIEALNAFGVNKEQLVEGYIAALASRDISVYKSAIRELQGLRASKEEMVLGYIGALASLNSDVRKSAVGNLNKLGASKEEIAVAYIKALHIPNNDVRKYAAKTLGKAGAEQSVEPLIKSLSDSSYDVQLSVIKSLGEIGDERAVASLIKKLDDPVVCLSAAYALGEINNKEVLSAPVQSKMKFVLLEGKKHEIKDLVNGWKGNPEKVDSFFTPIELDKIGFKYLDIMLNEALSILKHNPTTVSIVSKPAKYGTISTPIYEHSGLHDWPRWGYPDDDLVIVGTEDSYGLISAEQSRKVGVYTDTLHRELMILVGKIHRLDSNNKGIESRDESLKTVLNAQNSTFDALNADVLLLCGNDDIGTFRETLRLYKTGKIKKILLTGGYGRLTLPLMKATLKIGVTLKLYDNIIRSADDLTNLQIPGYEEPINLELLDKQPGREEFKKIIQVSEAVFINKIMHFLAKRMNIELDDNDIYLETKSTNTPENFKLAMPYIEQIKKDLGKDKISVAYMQVPHQQFRTKATFNRFSDEWNNMGVTGISYTTDWDTSKLSQEQIVEMAALEMTRLIIYTAKGDLVPLYGEEQGLDAVPDAYWKQLAQLVYNLNPEAKEKLKQSLFDLSFGVNIGGDHVFKTEKGLRDYLDAKGVISSVWLDSFINFIYTQSPKQVIVDESISIGMIKPVNALSLNSGLALVGQAI